MNKFLLLSLVLFALFLHVSYVHAEDEYEEEWPVRKHGRQDVDDGDDDDDDDDEGKPSKHQWGKHGHHGRHHRRHHGGRRRHHGHHGKHHHKHHGGPVCKRIPNCEKCFPSKGPCFKCKEGFFGVLSSTFRFGKPFIKSCEAQCPKGTKPFKKPWVGSVCVKTDCAPNCGFCMGDRCVKCANGTFQVPSKTRGRFDNKTCVTECPKGTKPFKKPWVGGICVKTDCAPNCGFCMEDRCVKCAKGTFVVPSKTRRRFDNKTCVTECPKGTKPVKKPWIGGICLKTDCAPNCGFCMGDRCVKCANGTFEVPCSKRSCRFFNKTCVTECPKGTKPVKKPWGSICVRTDCAQNCGACVMGKCVRCAEGSFALLSNKRKPQFRFGKPSIDCVTECPEGFTPETTKFGPACRPDKLPGSQIITTLGGYLKKMPDVFVG